MNPQGHRHDKKTVCLEAIQMGEMLNNWYAVLKQNLMVRLFRFVTFLDSRTIHPQTGDFFYLNQPFDHFG